MTDVRGFDSVKSRRWHSEHRYLLGSPAISNGKAYSAHRSVVCFHSPVIKDKIVPAPIPTANGYHHQQSFAFVYEYAFEDGDDAQCVDCIAQYFYRWDYKILGLDHGERPGQGLMYKEDADTSPENVDVDLGSDLVTHVKVFALTCKYEIDPLKSLSVAKFESAAQYYGKTHYFTDAAREAYSSDTIGCAREMSDCVVEFLHKRRHLLHKEHVKELMLDKPQLSLDLHLRSPVPRTPPHFLDSAGASIRLGSSGVARFNVLTRLNFALLIFHSY